jgi:hypothetical protein
MQYVCGAAIEQYWQGKLRELYVSLSLFPSQISVIILLLQLSNVQDTDLVLNIPGFSPKCCCWYYKYMKIINCQCNSSFLETGLESNILYTISAELITLCGQLWQIVVRMLTKWNWTFGMKSELYMYNYMYVVCNLLGCSPAYGV